MVEQLKFSPCFNESSYYEKKGMCPIPKTQYTESLFCKKTVPIQSTLIPHCSNSPIVSTGKPSMFIPKENRDFDPNSPLNLKFKQEYYENPYFPQFTGEIYKDPNVVQLGTEVAKKASATAAKLESEIDPSTGLSKPTYHIEIKNGKKVKVQDPPRKKTGNCLMGTVMAQSQADLIASDREAAAGHLTAAYRAPQFYVAHPDRFKIYRINLADKKQVKDLKPGATLILPQIANSKIGNVGKLGHIGQISKKMGVTYLSSDFNQRLTDAIAIHNGAEHALVVIPVKTALNKSSETASKTGSKPSSGHKHAQKFSKKA